MNSSKQERNVKINNLATKAFLFSQKSSRNIGYPSVITIIHAVLRMINDKAFYALITFIA
jgi:hypothetical protein